MGKTRDLFKKIRDTKGMFHAKMGSIKDRNSMDLTEAEDIKKRWQEYTEELYKKDLHDPDNHDAVITHLEPDILECEVKWALESITTNKASGGDGIPVELFQILEDDAVKVLHSICQPNWKTQQRPQDWKRSVFIPIPKKGNARECSNYCTIPLISHASKVMLKILQARLQQYVNRECQMFKLVLEKAEEPEIKLPISSGSLKKQEFQKNIYFCFIDYAKVFDCVDHNKLWKILKEMAIPYHLKVRLVKVMVFPVVMYGCESWTVKKAECPRIDAFELWFWKRLLRVPWTARRLNQSILKKITPGCSLEGMILKLKTPVLWPPDAKS